MKEAILIEPNDIKAILAKHFNVPEANIIKTQYSYTVILKSEENNETDN